MADDTRLPKAPELSDTLDAIARGRELVQQSQRLGDQADRQIEGVQATIEQVDRALDRSHQILSDKPTASDPARP